MDSGVVGSEDFDTEKDYLSERRTVSLQEFDTCIHPDVSSSHSAG